MTTVYGVANLAFYLNSDCGNKELALLEAGYKLDDMMIHKIEVIVTNIKGETTRLEVMDWRVELNDVFDENGILIE